MEWVHFLKTLDLKINSPSKIFGAPLPPSNIQSWALEVFFNFFSNKKWFFSIFYQVNILFLHQSYLKSPLPVKKNEKNANNYFLLLKKVKNTESAQLWNLGAKYYSKFHFSDKNSKNDLLRLDSFIFIDLSFGYLAPILFNKQLINCLLALYATEDSKLMFDA